MRRTYYTHASRLLVILLILLLQLGGAIVPQLEHGRRKKFGGFRVHHCNMSRNATKHLSDAAVAVARGWSGHISSA